MVRLKTKDMVGRIPFSNTYFLFHINFRQCTIEHILFNFIPLLYQVLFLTKSMATPSYGTARAYVSPDDLDMLRAVSILLPELNS